jgi:hypothetical protein
MLKVETRFMITDLYRKGVTIREVAPRDRPFDSA